MVKWFGKDPGAAPVGKAPATVDQIEMPYIRQLLDAYGEREAHEFKDHEAVKDHTEFGVHLAMQRERFFDADAFSRFYRDNTMSEEIDVLNNDMLHGVIDVHRGNHDDLLSPLRRSMVTGGERSTFWGVITVCACSRQTGNSSFCERKARLLWRKK